MPDTTSASRRPRASSIPTWRFRLSVPVQVTTRSPRPLKPASVSRRPPAAHASRVTSARPRVISAARAFWPRPRPSATPDAMAMTFFIAPPISTPITSSLPYRRRYGLRNSAWTSSVAGASADAASTAVGSCCATSIAKLGPDSTTTGRPAPASSATTSDMRSSVSVSSPFAALTSTTPDGICGAAARTTPRQPCDGIARTITSAPATASAARASTSTPGGSVTSGR